MPFAIKHIKRIKVQGSLETLRLKTLYKPPLGHHSLARLFQHLAFVFRCLSSESQFASMPIFHHYNVHRLHGHGAPHLGASLHPPLLLDYAPHVPMGQHQHTTNLLPPRCQSEMG